MWSACRPVCIALQGGLEGMHEKTRLESLVASLLQATSRGRQTMNGILCVGLERDRLVEIGVYFEWLDAARSPVNWRHPLVSVIMVS